jgi:hypothetical protein
MVTLLRINRLAALSTGKVKRTSRPTSPSSSSSASASTTASTLSSSISPHGNLIASGAASGGMSSFASRLTGVLDAPISAPSHVGSTNRAVGNISSATTSSTKRQSIGEMYLNGGNASPVPK